MTRLQIHHMADGGATQAKIADTCGVGLRSVERILTEDRPMLSEIVADTRANGRKLGRPPKADASVVEKIRKLLETEPRIQSTEVLRRSRDWGFTGGRSQMAELCRKLRPKPAAEPVVLFEGLPGEYIQFDFGEANVRVGEAVVRVQFFAARLKYSRFMHVEIVADQQAETLVRSVIASIAALGGSTKEWVFDNPRTVRVSKPGVHPPVLHRHLAQLVAEYRVIPTLCAPRSGNQKGSVERLVGYVKNSFLRTRKFADAADLQRQLAEWLHEVNHVRPSDATGVIPAVARQDERPYLQKRPLQASAEGWELHDSATVTPMGTIRFENTWYSTNGDHLGAAATLCVTRSRVKIEVGGETCWHPRRPGTGAVQRLPEHRDDVVKLLHGRRKIATFKRECLRELGGAAEAFLVALIHGCESWEEPCAELYHLLQSAGDRRLHEAMRTCVADGCCTVVGVRKALRVAA